MSHPIPDPPAAVSVTRLMHPETRAMLAAGFDRAGVLRPAPSLVARWVEGQWRGEEGVADLIARHVLDLEAEVAELRELAVKAAARTCPWRGGVPDPCGKPSSTASPYCDGHQEISLAAFSCGACGQSNVGGPVGTHDRYGQVCGGCAAICAGETGTEVLA